MKRILAFLLNLARIHAARGANGFHDDRLRANQPNHSDRAFSYWRALVS